ncbi:MAG: YfhO family protein, partial [Cytophagales bacterium]
NYFMFDYFPGYNKFRSQSFALVIILLVMPLIGMMGLEKFITEGATAENKKKLLIAFGIVGGFCLALILFAGFGTYMGEGDDQLPVWFKKALMDDRASLLRADAFRSLAFIAGIFIMLYLNVFKKISPNGFFALLIFMTMIDVAVVDRRYFTKENFQRKRDNSTFVANAADDVILKDKSHYRVFNIQGTFTEARTSYFHYSLGGYHGAKLRRYQDLYDSCIVRERQQLFVDAQQGQINFSKYGVLNMLNTKYVVYGEEANNVIPNTSANGPAWFVSQVTLVDSPNEEIKKLREIDTRATAVVDQSKNKLANTSLLFDSLSTVLLAEFKPSYVRYQSQSTQNGLAVFSEIYYPKGWKAFIDGKESPIIRANYVLRALEVPAGNHTIEFKFEPEPYVIGNKVTLASSWVVLLVMLGCVGMNIRKSE